MTITTLKIVDDCEPTCPYCSNANAMLFDGWSGKSSNQADLKCRDCGLEIKAGAYRYELEEVMA